MEKLIIENRTDLSMYDVVLNFISYVIGEGKISGTNNDQYCYVTTFKIDDGKDREIIVYSDKNKKSDRLIAMYYPKKSKGSGLKNKPV